MQIVNKHLVLAFSAIFLASCGGTLAQKPSKNSENAALQSQNSAAENTQSASETQNDASSSSKKAEKLVTQSGKNSKLDDSVFSAKNKGLTGEVLQYLMVAEIAGQRGKLNVAVANYLQAAKISQDPNVAERASRISIFARQDTAALEAGRIWVKLAPKSADAHQIVAAMLVRTGNTAGALEHFEKVLELSKKDEQKAFMLIVSLLGKERDKHLALDIMKGLLAKHQSSPNAYYAYSTLGLLTKEYEIANKSIDKAIELKKDWNEALILKVTILSRLGRNDEAILFLNNELTDNPDNHTLRMYFARKLVDDKQYDLAYQEFNKVYSEDESNDALYAMGLLANQMGNVDLAEEHFEQLTEVDGRKNEANFYLGQIEEKKKNLSKAIDRYTRVHSGIYAFESRLRIIILLGKQGKVAKAREQVKTLNVTKPGEQVRLYIVEGEVLRENKMYVEARNLYTEGLTKIPDNLDLLYARALVYEKLNNVDDAVKDLRTVVKLDPQSVQALNALGYTLVDKTEQIEEGMEYIQQAYQLRPNDPAIIDSLGWAYYRLGKLEQAVNYLKKAYSTFNDAEVAAHLGEVLWVRGDKDEAQKIWENSLQTEPEHDKLKNVMKRFLQ